MAEVLGWNVVVGKGEFSPGDLAVYFEVDSWLDASNPAFASFEERFTNWGTKRGMRLKTIKLRKQISQGLLMPIEKFVELSPSCYGLDAPKEGDDVTETLKIEKWESVEEAKSNSGGTLPSRTRAFPWFIRKTDQERVQNMIGMLEKAKDEWFQVTYKLDGSSMTVYAIHRAAPIYREIMEERKAKELAKLGKVQRLFRKLKEVFVKPQQPEVLVGVCSRNIELDVDGDNHFSTFVREHGILEKLVSRLNHGEALAFQGELVGPSIQNNYEKVDGFQWYVFDVFDINKQEYKAPALTLAWTAHFGFKHVPVLDHSTPLRLLCSREEGDVVDGRTIVEACLGLAEGPGMNPGVRREGIVFKSNDRDFSFKAISQSYLLKKG